MEMMVRWAVARTGVDVQSIDAFQKEVQSHGYFPSSCKKRTFSATQRGWDVRFLIADHPYEG